MELGDLPFEIRWPATRALTFWRRGDLAEANAQLDVAARAVTELAHEFGRVHVLHLRACVAFAEGDVERSRALHSEVLTLCHELDFLGGMGSALCDLAIIDLTVGDIDAAVVHYERGLACYEEGGYEEDAAKARDMWARAAAS